MRYTSVCMCVCVHACVHVCVCLNKPPYINAFLTKERIGRKEPAINDNQRNNRWIQWKLQDVEKENQGGDMALRAFVAL